MKKKIFSPRIIKGVGGILIIENDKGFAMNQAQEIMLPKKYWKIVKNKIQ